MRGGEERRRKWKRELKIIEEKEWKRIEKIRERERMRVGETNIGSERDF